jgi:hypothetical protein
MEATRYSEMSVYNKPTRRHIPEDGILHSHRRENFKSYTIFSFRGCDNSNVPGYGIMYSVDSHQQVIYGRLF